MKPNETRWHVEYWYPTAQELDIYRLQVPKVVLRPVASIPLFGWTPEQEVKVWIDLVKAAANNAPLPKSPAVHQLLWQPSGMENLDAAFRNAIRKTTSETQSLWQFYYGTWLAGRDRKEEAITVLSQTQNGLSKAVLARLLKAKGDVKGAAEAFEAISEKWLQLHPQIVLERDRVLRSLGTNTLAERENWLSMVAALPDEWIIERRVQLLIDKGELNEAKELLLTTRFQKVHQTYTRTCLWLQLCEKLRLPCDPIPVQLGEDRLANFGAYR